MNTATEPAPITFREKVAYGLGDFASSMFWRLFMMFLMFFYTDVFGISAAVVGTMFLITRIWDSVNDPLMGMIADRTNTRWGKFRPFLLFGAIPFAVIGILIFSTPDFGLTGKIIYAYITYNLMMVIYTVVNVPYAALMGVMTANTEQRTLLASYRFLGAFSGSLFVVYSMPYVVEYFEGRLDTAAGYQAAVAIYAIFAAVLFMLTFAGTKERLQPPRERNTFRDDLKDIMKNKPWFIMLAANISFLVFNSMRDAAIIYYIRNFIGTQEIMFFGSVSPTAMISSYGSIWIVANIVGVSFAKPVARRFGKKRTFLTAMIATTVMSFALFFLLPHQIELILMLNFVMGVTTGINLPIIWSMFADIADYSEWKNFRRATGLIFSSSSMSQKFGFAIGGALSGYLLALFAYQEGGVIQSDTAVLGIRLLISVFAGMGALLCCVFLYFYKLDDETMKNVTADLVERRKQE
jgi:glycoside/pentoside/hexuronide:cation symporter, GPH family